MKIFISYTSSDKDWAHWIAWNLREAGHEPFVHEWEIGAGQNIARWMEERAKEAHHLIGVFSDPYCEALYSQSERWAAYWNDPGGRSGFLVPIEVRKVAEWPKFVSPLKRLSLIGLGESEASRRLIAFLEPPTAPTVKPAFPGGPPPTDAGQTSFTQGGEPLGSRPPSFPASLPVEEKEKAAPTPVSTILSDPEKAIRCIDDYEPKPLIFGRDDEIETIVGVLVTGGVTLIAGGPGMGKTALATVAFYDPRIVVRFGRRRIFASLETATEPRAILAKLVENLGLPPTGDEVSLLRIIEASAAGRPLAAILDNAKTVFDINRGEAERLLNLVARVQGLSLAVTIRGVAPPIPGAIPIDDLPKLPAGPARDAFLSIAGTSFSADPNLPHLLEALDGHALSIHLVAAQAIGLPSLQGLRESWDEAHAEILRIAGEEERRLTSVRASMTLSLNSRRMKSTPLARRLMALLAFLPGGLAEDDVRLLLGERGAMTRAKANEAVACLHQLRLVERRVDRRLRMLTPLRECVKIDVPPLEGDKGRIIERYLTLAAKAYAIGSKDWEKVREEVVTEADNLDTVCELAVLTSLTQQRLERAFIGLTEFHRHSGLGGIGSIEQAATRLRSKSPSSLAAKCVESLGDIARLRSDYGVARARLEEALTLYRHIRDELGEARCIVGLGDIGRMRSDYDTACARFEEALALARRIGRVLTQANCIQGLGYVALARSDHETACAHFEEALALARRVGDVVGEANCIMGLADIARRRSDHETARTRFEEALALNRRIGAVMGEANCIVGLGRVALARSDHETARMRCEEALALFRRIGGVAVEANGVYILGDIARALRSRDGAYSLRGGAGALSARWGRFERGRRYDPKRANIASQHECRAGTHRYRSRLCTFFQHYRP